MACREEREASESKRMAPLRRAAPSRSWMHQLILSFLGGDARLLQPPPADPLRLKTTV